MAMKIAHTEEEIERAGAGKDEPKLFALLYYIINYIVH